MYSKVDTASPLASRSAASSIGAASTLGMATIAVAVSVGAGKSLRTAAVTTPRLPSAPRKSCFRS